MKTRLEAIKLVNQFHKEKSDELNSNAIDWIKMFFNITEEELTK